jgi:hypothetical protein
MVFYLFAQSPGFQANNDRKQYFDSAYFARGSMKKAFAGNGVWFDLAALFLCVPGMGAITWR